MILCGVIDGPPYGYCSCGWPLLPDGTCSDGECSCAWRDPEDEEDVDDDE